MLKGNNGIVYGSLPFFSPILQLYIPGITTPSSSCGQEKPINAKKKKKKLKEPHLQTHRIQQKGDRKIQNLHLGLVKKKNF